MAITLWEYDKYSRWEIPRDMLSDLIKWNPTETDLLEKQFKNIQLQYNDFIEAIGKRGSWVTIGATLLAKLDTIVLEPNLPVQMYDIAIEMIETISSKEKQAEQILRDISHRVAQSLIVVVEDY